LKQPTKKTQHPKKKKNYFHVYFFQKNKIGQKKFKKTMSGNLRGASTLIVFLSFNDHFINASVDLSNVFFIATANSLEDIPGPLRDRMDIIQLGSYTHTEKAHIVKNHLIKKLTTEYCLENGQIYARIPRGKVLWVYLSS
jgi:hypothetical protein